MQVKLEFVALIKVETERLGRGGEGIRLQADGLMSMLAQAENRMVAMHLPEITLAAFSIFNILRLGSYLPQIVRIVMNEDGAKVISYST